MFVSHNYACESESNKKFMWKYLSERLIQMYQGTRINAHATQCTENHQTTATLVVAPMKINVIRNFVQNNVCVLPSERFTSTMNLGDKTSTGRVAQYARQLTIVTAQWMCER
jgi:hypothetical protein